jgi:hypothetical protein
MSILQQKNIQKQYITKCSCHAVPSGPVVTVWLNCPKSQVQKAHTQGDTCAGVSNCDTLVKRIHCSAASRPAALTACATVYSTSAFHIIAAVLFRGQMYPLPVHRGCSWGVVFQICTAHMTHVTWPQLHRESFTPKLAQPGNGEPLGIGSGMLIHCCHHATTVTCAWGRFNTSTHARRSRRSHTNVPRRSRGGAHKDWRPHRLEGSKGYVIRRFRCSYMCGTWNIHRTNIG